MDVFSDILKSVNFRTAVYFKTDLSAPWGMKMEGSQVAQFHLIIRGRCFVKPENSNDPEVLYGGDLVVFPRGQAHWLADQPRSKKVPGQEMLESILGPHQAGENGHNKEQTTLICGHFEWTPLDHPFFNHLPEMIKLSVSTEQSNLLESMVNIIINEKGSSQPGEDVVVNRLAEVLFIEILRLYTQKTASEPSFLQALVDPKVNQALSIMHQKPEMSWSLASLAKDVGLSRTLFANRFRDLIGQTPIDYLTNWRMIKAKELLRSTTNPMSQIATQVGYTSEVSFHRVFKSRFNTTPGAFRRNRE